MWLWLVRLCVVRGWYKTHWAALRTGLFAHWRVCAWHADMDVACKLCPCRDTASCTHGNKISQWRTKRAILQYPIRSLYRHRVRMARCDLTLHTPAPWGDRGQSIPLPASSRVNRSARSPRPPARSPRPPTPQIPGADPSTAACAQIPLLRPVLRSLYCGVDPGARTYWLKSLLERHASRQRRLAMPPLLISAAAWRSKQQLSVSKQQLSVSKQQLSVSAYANSVALTTHCTQLTARHHYYY